MRKMHYSLWMIPVLLSVITACNSGTKRKAYHLESDFTRLGLNPRETDIVVVKIGYMVPELYDMRADWIMALTPGGVDQDLERLEYKRIIRPMFPLDKEMDTPDLSAIFVPSSDEIKF